jgi:hypothetical protein
MKLVYSISNTCESRKQGHETLTTLVGVSYPSFQDNCVENSIDMFHSHKTRIIL